VEVDLEGNRVGARSEAQILYVQSEIFVVGSNYLYCLPQSSRLIL